jgi:hypothetical protein
VEHDLRDGELAVRSLDEPTIDQLEEPVRLALGGRGRARAVHRLAHEEPRVAHQQGVGAKERRPPRHRHRHAQALHTRAFTAPAAGAAVEGVARGVETGGARIDDARVDRERSTTEAAIAHPGVRHAGVEHAPVEHACVAGAGPSIGKPALRVSTQRQAELDVPGVELAGETRRPDQHEEEAAVSHPHHASLPVHSQVTVAHWPHMPTRLVFA